jgi:hypothetical protein
MSKNYINSRVSIINNARNHTGNRLSLNNLDDIANFVSFLPITDDSLKMAATLWAESRLSGTPTADDSSLDAD